MRKRVWFLAAGGVKLRWTFGMYCRRTQIPVLYYLEKKRNVDLTKYMKRHIAPGTPIITDENAAYVNLKQSRSKLTPLGYFHFWINHAAMQMVHPKFTFIHN